MEFRTFDSIPEFDEAQMGLRTTKKAEQAVLSKEKETLHILHKLIMDEQRFAQATLSELIDHGDSAETHKHVQHNIQLLTDHVNELKGKLADAIWAGGASTRSEIKRPLRQVAFELQVAVEQLDILKEQEVARAPGMPPMNQQKADREFGQLFIKLDHLLARIDQDLNNDIDVLQCSPSFNKVIHQSIQEYDATLSTIESTLSALQGPSQGMSPKALLDNYQAKAEKVKNALKSLKYHHAVFQDTQNRVKALVAPLPLPATPSYYDGYKPLQGQDGQAPSPASPSVAKEEPPRAKEEPPKSPIRLSNQEDDKRSFIYIYGELDDLHSKIKEDLKLLHINISNNWSNLTTTPGTSQWYARELDLAIQEHESIILNIQSRVDTLTSPGAATQALNDKYQKQANEVKKALVELKAQRAAFRDTFLSSPEPTVSVAESVRLALQDVDAHNVGIKCHQALGELRQAGELMRPIYDLTRQRFERAKASQQVSFFESSPSPRQPLESESPRATVARNEIKMAWSEFAAAWSKYSSFSKNELRLERQLMTNDFPKGTMRLEDLPILKQLLSKRMVELQLQKPADQTKSIADINQMLANLSPADNWLLTNDLAFGPLLGAYREAQQTAAPGVLLSPAQNASRAFRTVHSILQEVDPRNVGFKCNQAFRELKKAEEAMKPIDDRVKERVQDNIRRRASAPDFVDRVVLHIEPPTETLIQNELRATWKEFDKVWRQNSPLGEKERKVEAQLMTKHLSPMVIRTLPLPIVKQILSIRMVELQLQPPADRAKTIAGIDQMLTNLVTHLETLNHDLQIGPMLADYRANHP